MLAFNRFLLSQCENNQKIIQIDGFVPIDGFAMEIDSFLVGIPANFNVKTTLLWPQSVQQSKWDRQDYTTLFNTINK